MATTTIRIEDDLKSRIALAAQRVGKSAHAFILDSIAQKVQQVEQDDAFHLLADQRWGQIQASGETVPWDDAKAYLAARARGEPAAKPRARSFSK